jgi:dTDP-4-dehydrorhamnose 3,5-epimerase
MEANHVDFEPNYALASVNPTAGTLRGMHFQQGSAGEARLISCVSGAVHNISIDLRQGSPTFLIVEINELRASDGQAILVPPGCANGWMTLEPNTVLCYQVSGRYSPEASTGIRFNDPAFDLRWPLTPTVISEADQQWPDFDMKRAEADEQ